MASFRSFLFLAGGTAATLVAAFPAQAEELASQMATVSEAADAVAAVEVEATDTPIEAAGLSMATVLENQPEAAIAPASDIAPEMAIVPPVVEEAAPIAATEPEQVANQTLDEYLQVSEVAPSDTAFAISAESLEMAQTIETAPEATEVAQVTRPLYRGVTPFYIGVGGNIGIIDSGNSAVGDFGFNIFSKVSLGPRFAVRPMLQFSEDDFNIALPVTFNFNPVDLGRFSVYPSLGGGVDFGDDVGLLVNGGLDVPISRDFTFNGQVNWRVTEDTGLGVSLGVGYNFPVFFE